MFGETLAATSNPTRIEPAAHAAFTRVDVYETAEPILDAWAELETSTPCSTYQTRAWLLPWIDTLGRQAGLTPCFVAARGPSDRIVGLLCLGLYRSGPVRIATWLGGKDSNFNMPLLRTWQAWSAGEIKRLLVEAASKLEQRPDLFLLMNQPVAWQSQTNPFAALPHQLSPSSAYGTTLQRDAEALLQAKMSKDSRRKLRKKEARLAAMGPLTHRVAQTAEEQRTILDVFLAQKVQRLQALGVSSQFDTPEMREFLTRASAPHGRGIEFHALCVGDRIVAVNAGNTHAGQWNGMVNSFDMDEEIAKSSPGDILMMRVLAKACEDGVAFFDLGIGEARYKSAIGDLEIALCDTMLPVSVKGHAYARAMSLKQAVKRRIKQNARLFALAKRARARLDR